MKTAPRCEHGVTLDKDCWDCGFDALAHPDHPDNRLSLAESDILFI